MMTMTRKTGSSKRHNIHGSIYHIGHGHRQTQDSTYTYSICLFWPQDRHLREYLWKVCNSDVVTAIRVSKDYCGVVVCWWKLKKQTDQRKWEFCSPRQRKTRNTIAEVAVVRQARVYYSKER